MKITLNTPEDFDITEETYAKMVTDLTTLATEAKENKCVILNFVIPDDIILTEYEKTLQLQMSCLRSMVMNSKINGADKIIVFGTQFEINCDEKDLIYNIKDILCVNWDLIDIDTIVDDIIRKYAPNSIILA